MQITLVQNEIEQAIREYVNRQLKVAEGMRLEIKLSATRGDEGFKAAIDITQDTRRDSSAGSQQVPHRPHLTSVSTERTSTERDPEVNTSHHQETSGQTADTPSEDGKMESDPVPEAPREEEEPRKEAVNESPAVPERAPIGRNLFKGAVRPKN